jgi:hypothetical protein
MHVRRKSSFLSLAPGPSQRRKLMETGALLSQEPDAVNGILLTINQ